MTCDDADLLLAGAALGAVETAEADGLEDHLRACERCRRAAAGYLGSAEVLAVALDPVEPPDGLRTALMARVYAEASPARQHATAPPTPAPGERWWRLAWRTVPASRALTLVGLGAVAAAIVLGAVTAVRSTPGSPATVAYQVQGTTAQPGAHGTLRYDPATVTAVLTVSGLRAPAAQPGGAQSSVELWLLGPEGPPVAAGFLVPEPNTATWTAALHADLTHYRSVAATVEPAGGSPTPSSAEILAVSLAG